MANYLTFASAEPFTIAIYNATKNWNGTLYYSTDAATWNEWDGTTAISSAEHEGEQRIYMRGSGNSKITGGSNRELVLTGNNIRCSGNIENLLDYETVASGEHPTMGTFCYCDLFEGCTSLVQAPELPATTLTDYCYSSMFRKCTSLTEAPELPATTLDENCYTRMFENCTSLTKVPKFSATTLAYNCCYFMFNGCTSLTEAPELPATTLAMNCYWAMFFECTSLVTAPKLPATTLASCCYFAMFHGCTSLAEPPKLPATTLEISCYERMFYGCTSLKLSATQIDEYTKEYRIPTSGTGKSTADALLDMFTNTGGTLTGTPEINTTYYLAAPVVEVPALDPKSLMLGWLMGRAVAGQRKKEET